MVDLTDSQVLVIIGIVSLFIAIITAYLVWRQVKILRARTLEKPRAGKPKGPLQRDLLSPSVREHMVRVQVIGQTGVGKSWFLRQIDEEWNAKRPAPTLVPTDMKAEHIRKLGGEIAKIVYEVTDVPGGKPETWLDAIARKQPQGLVVMVDHSLTDSKTTIDKKRITSQVGMLQYFVRPLAGSQRLNKCKALLFIVNKKDLWGRHHRTRSSIIETYKREFSDLKGHFSRAFFVKGSVKTSEGIPRALTQFENTILGVR